MRLQIRIFFIAQAMEHSIALIGYHPAVSKYRIERTLQRRGPGAGRKDGQHQRENDTHSAMTDEGLSENGNPGAPLFWLRLFSLLLARHISYLDTSCNKGRHPSSPMPPAIL